MPTIVDKLTGEELQKIGYGKNQALEVEQALANNPEAAVVNNAMERSSTTWEDGSVLQSPDKNIPDPYGSYSPMASIPTGNSDNAYKEDVS